MANRHRHTRQHLHSIVSGTKQLNIPLRYIGLSGSAHFLLDSRGEYLRGFVTIMVFLVIRE